MKKAHHRRFSGTFRIRTVRERILSLLSTPFFWLITLWGNACVVGGSIAFYALERGTNPAVQDFLDCLIWGVGMVTTVGGGVVNPVTPGGKVLTIVMMMGGALFLWSYMALFVGAFVNPELKDIEREVSELQHDMEAGEQLLIRMRRLTAEIENHFERQKNPK